VYHRKRAYFITSSPMEALISTHQSGVFYSCLCSVPISQECRSSSDRLDYDRYGALPLNDCSADCVALVSALAS
jgi:hypothetical protein